MMAPLEEINVATGGAGDMTSEVRFGVDRIMDGNDLANHQSGAPNHDPVIACGEIPARTT